jgi:hypothetical protein
LWSWHREQATVRAIVALVSASIRSSIWSFGFWNRLPTVMNPRPASVDGSLAAVGSWSAAICSFRNWSYGLSALKLLIT